MTASYEFQGPRSDTPIYLHLTEGSPANFHFTIVPCPHQAAYYQLFQLGFVSSTEFHFSRYKLRKSGPFIRLLLKVKNHLKQDKDEKATQSEWNM